MLTSTEQSWLVVGSNAWMVWWPATLAGRSAVIDTEPAPSDVADPSG